MTIISKAEWEDENLLSDSDNLKIPDYIPRKFVVADPLDTKYLHLQQQMMDNGWKLIENESYVEPFSKHGENIIIEFFSHPTYGDLKVPVFTYETGQFYGNKLLKFPHISQEQDPKGLGCSIVSIPYRGWKIVSNEWKSFWTTRKGRKRSRYLQYLQERKEVRKMIEAMSNA